MNRLKTIFCLFLGFISFVYLNDIKKINVLDIVNGKKIEVIKTISNKDFKDPISLLDIKDKTYEIKKIETVSNQNINSNPVIYIYNTHQTEEYASNIYNITPTVVTTSNILQDELKNLKIESLIETKDVIKEVKKRGLDYPGTYEVSLDYLMEREKQYPSLKYFFDIHRDSIKGEASRIKINGKSYAKVMFLVGANYEGYEKTLKEVKIMENYLNKNYPGLVRNTFINNTSGYNQKYRDNMYLIEVGGTDNTLEEIYNSSYAIAKAIKVLMESQYEN